MKILKANLVEEYFCVLFLILKIISLINLIIFSKFFIDGDVYFSYKQTLLNSTNFLFLI